MGKVTAVQQQYSPASEQSRYYLLCKVFSVEWFNAIVRGHWGIENQLIGCWM